MEGRPSILYGGFSPQQAPSRLLLAEGSEQMLISPGALDMAGVIVTTRQEDFDKITEEKVASIIKEVGITVEEAEKIPGRYFDEKAKR